MARLFPLSLPASVRLFQISSGVRSTLPLWSTEELSWNKPHQPREAGQGVGTPRGAVGTAWGAVGTPRGGYGDAQPA